MGQLWSVLSKRKHEAQFPVSFGVAVAASEATPQDLCALRSSFRCVHLEESFLVQMRTGDLEFQSRGRLETGWDPGLLPPARSCCTHPPLLGSFLCFLLRKRMSGIIFFTSSSFPSFNLYYTTGNTWFIFTLGTWPGQCLENQEYSERRSFVFAPSFSDRSFTLVLICVTVLGVVPYLRIFSLGCVSGQ